MARHDLTDREKQVVGELAKGKTNVAIAQSLGVSIATVKQRLTTVMLKWNCDNRTQVAVEAIRHAEKWAGLVQERNSELSMPRVTAPSVDRRTFDVKLSA